MKRKRTTFTNAMVLFLVFIFLTISQVLDADYLMSGIYGIAAIAAGFTAVNRYRRLK